MSDKRSFPTEVDPPAMTKKRLKSALNDDIEKEFDSLQVTFGVFSDVDNSWGRDYFSVSTDNSFYDLARFLCDKILVKLRSRNCGGSGVNEHIWYLEFGDEVAEKKKKKIKWKIKINSPSSLFGWDDDEYESKEGIQKIDSNSAIGSLHLKSGMHGKFTYDLGTTTVIFLRVLQIIPIGDNSGTFPRLIDLPGPIDYATGTILPLSIGNRQTSAVGVDVNSRSVSKIARPAVLAAIPAYSEAEQTLDKLFPHFAAVVTSGRFDNVAIGLSNIITGDDDAMFAEISTGASFSTHGKKVCKNVLDLYSLIRNSIVFLSYVLPIPIP